MGSDGRAVNDDAIFRAKRVLIALDGDPADLHAMVIIGPPRAQKRHRTGQGRTYDPSEPDKRALARELAGFTGRPYVGNLAVVALFYLPDLRRVDRDNLEKLLLDAGTRAGLWHDDCQVTGGAVILELDRANPRTVVLIGRHRSTLDRSGVGLNLPRRRTKGVKPGT